MSPMVAFLLFIIPSTLAHISMQFPVPRDTKNGVSYAKWEQNEPMIGVHPTICHGLDHDVTIRDANKFNVGDSIQIELYGSAVHDGGHCSFWYSTDDETFTKIIDVKDCTLDGAEVILPDTMPTACNDRCTFAWTWSPRVSQACEIYMNCADIQVSGSLGHDETQNPVSINFQTSFIDQGPSDPEDPIIEHYGCVRVDEVSHWTPIFGEIDTNYDYTDNEYEHNVVTNPDNTNGNTNDNTVCYSNPSMAINLDAEIDTDGQCGNGANDYRCDDGSCCSQSGYCGATDDFCNANSVADWRVTACSDSSSTSTPTTTVSPASTTTASSTAVPSSTTTPTTSTDNIQIVNHHGVSEWYFAANVNGISDGFALNKFEIQKANNEWFECGQCADSSSLYTCILDSQIALPVSVRLSAAHSDGSQHIITSQNFISTFDYGEISDFGSNFAASSTSSPTTTSAATSSTDSTQSGNPQQITFTNRGSSGVWWYAVTPSDPITSIEMRGSGQPDWEMGAFVSEYAGDYYTFNQNINGPYQLPLSFRITTLDGTVTIADDVITLFDEGVSATIDVSGNAPFRFEDDKDDNGNGSVFGFYGFVTIIAVIVVGLIIAVIVWRRRMSKAQVSIDKEIEIEIENSVVVDPEMGIQIQQQIDQIQQQIDGSKTTELR